MNYKCKFGIHWVPSYNPMSAWTSHMPILYNVLYTVKYTLPFNILFTVLYSIPYTVLYTILYINVQFAGGTGFFSNENYPFCHMYIVLNNLHCILKTVHVHCTVHCTMYCNVNCSLLPTRKGIESSLQCSVQYSRKGNVSQ